MFFKGFLEGFRLLDSIGVQLMFDDLLLEDFVAELELVDAVDKVLLTDEQTVCLRACTND